MALVSIIIPIYNAENYLRLCLESILAQKVADFELLLVNDGSKDRSLDICNEYASRDSRIRVFDKPNGGVCSARNLGLEKAQGEYVMFVDADDWLVPNALSVCLPYIPEYDIVKYGAVVYMADGTSYNISAENPKSKDEAMELVIARKTIVAPWGMLIRRELFDRYNIRFDPIFTVGEDWLVVAQLLFHATSLKFLPNVYAYNYNRVNETSCTNNLTLKKRVQQYTVLKRIESLVGGDRYSKAFGYTRTMLTLEMVAAHGKRETAEWLHRESECGDFLRLKDLIVADVSLKRKIRLLKLLCKSL
ncbi:MAG: glycosyltransferase family 2 protein [Rikenellaceae bacterium]|nr:glycosyltransferase family 2 protein [Rikenellaceae bacterium]